jgi:hypothetical protein
MCRILRLAIRCSAERPPTGDLLAAVAGAANAELLGHDRVAPFTYAAVAVDDDRPDELVAIDFAVALHAVAGQHGVKAAGVRLVDTDTARP